MYCQLEQITLALFKKTAYFLDMDNSKLKLFAVLLGGKAPGAHVEVHDLVFVVGKDLPSLYPLLKEKWFGTKNLG